MLLVAPLIIILCIFYFYPLLKLFPESLYRDGHLSLENYNHFFRTPLYTFILFRTIRIAAETTILCFLLGYPTAYLMASVRNPRITALMMLCIMLPFFTSILARSYSWIALLQTKGFVNFVLINLGFIERPVRLLYNEYAVLVGMVHIMLPFMILPIYSVLRNIDTRLVKAARNLGANSREAFIRITFPLSLPGIGAGVMITFILALGFYITPALLGGPSTLMMSTLIDQQVNRLGDWEFAGAIVVVLLASTILIVSIFDKLVGLDKIYK